MPLANDKPRGTFTLQDYLTWARQMKAATWT